MKSTYLILPALIAAASLSAQSQAPTMSYNSVRAGYADEFKVIEGWGASGSVLLGDSVILTAGYQWAELSSASNFDGDGYNLGLGYRYAVGPGDLIFSVNYRELSMDGLADDGLGGFVAASADADSIGFGLSYRLPISKETELTVGYQYLDYDISGEAFYSFDGTVSGLAGDVDFEDHAVNVALRFNVTDALDVTVGFSWYDELDSSWNATVGYNF